MIEQVDLAAITGIYGLLLINTALIYQVRTTQKLCKYCPKEK